MRVVWLVAMSDNDKTDLEETGTEQSDLGSLSDNSDKSTTESESPSDNLDSDTSLSAPYSYETSQVAEAEDSSSDDSEYDRLSDTGKTNRYSAPVHYSSYYSRCECSQCIIMNTSEECICCKYVTYSYCHIADKVNERCIIEHPCRIQFSVS